MGSICKCWISIASIATAWPKAVVGVLHSLLFKTEASAYIKPEARRLEQQEHMLYLVPTAIYDGFIMLTTDM